MCISKIRPQGLSVKWFSQYPGLHTKIGPSRNCNQIGMLHSWLPPQIDKVMRRQDSPVHESVEVQQIPVATEEVGVGKLVAMLHLCQSLARCPIDVLPGPDGLGQQIPFRLLLAIGQAIVVTGIQIAVVVHIPVQILQQVADAPGLLLQVLPPPLQKCAEATGIVSGKGIPDFLQAEAELLKILYPADVANLVIAVIVVANLLAASFL